jgi:hypothetical protein
MKSFMGQILGVLIFAGAIYVVFCLLRWLTGWGITMPFGL